MKCRWQASVAERASVAKHLFFLHSSSFCDFFCETGFKSSAKQSALDFVALHCPSIWWLFLSNWFQIFLFDNLWDFVVSHSSFTHLDCRSLFTDPADSFENQIPTLHFLKPIYKEFIPAQKVKKRLGDKIGKNWPSPSTKLISKRMCAKRPQRWWLMMMYEMLNE